jgi:hypothetical protein
MINSIPNPKKTINVPFNANKIGEMIKALPSLEKKYKLTKFNDAFKVYTLEAYEFLSLGIFADFSLNDVSEGKTEITIEIRRKIGAFDQRHEISSANRHLDCLIDLLGNLSMMSEEKLQALISSSVDESKEREKIANKPWHESNFLIVVTLFIFFPLGLYGIYKRVSQKPLQPAY